MNKIVLLRYYCSHVIRNGIDFPCIIVVAEDIEDIDEIEDNEYDDIYDTEVMEGNDDR